MEKVNLVYRGDIPDMSPLLLPGAWQFITLYESGYYHDIIVPEMTYYRLMRRKNTISYNCEMKVDD